ncbi:hypothetical protein [Agaribacterium sp. ZY112]|uniref:hypothetical protein n=1 Tax=Agaribacterium sp. ZY112 TaxID=3233574 RepID=UPI0035244741
MKFKIYYLLILLFPVSVNAATYVSGVSTTITRIDTHHYGKADGDVRISVSDSVPGCESGYFITADSQSIEKALSIALSAYHSGSKVVIGGQSGIQWDGTSRTDYCHVHSISLSK